MFDETPIGPAEFYEVMDTIDYLFPRGRISDSYPFKPLRDDRRRQETRAGGGTSSRPSRIDYKLAAPSSLTDSQRAVRDYWRAWANRPRKGA